MGDRDLRLKFVYDSHQYFSQTCNVGEPHNRRLFYYASQPISSRYGAQKSRDYSTLEFREWFMDPRRLKRFLESQNGVRRYQFMGAFISFLLQLLQPADETRRHQFNRVENLDKELRVLLTILGDSSLLLCDDGHKEFQYLWAEFEAVIIEAATSICSLVKQEKEDFGDVHFGHLEKRIKKSFKLLSSISRSASVTPNTSVVDSLLIVNSLTYDLKDLMNREDNPIADADLKNQIKRLYQGLILTRSSIKDIGPPRPSEIGELKEPLMLIGDMAHRAEHLIISFLAGNAPPWFLIPSLIDINDKIEIIRTMLKEITKKYKSGCIKVAEYFSAQLALPATGFTEVDDVAVGVEDNARDILHQLVGGTERLQVISIFGMPGLGKTTLAKKLYNHRLVNYSFHRLTWCVISQNYQRQTMLANILIHINSELEKPSIRKMEEEALVWRIHKTLKGRKYLIVMDDVWDFSVWADLRRCFPDDRNGSRILLTSRNKDVAPLNSKMYELPFLSNDQCWELLEKKVFSSTTCPPELQGIGKKIAANCHGLPLAVSVIAGILLTTDKEERAWEEVGENLTSYILSGDGNSVMQILKLSYKHLPDHLKPCFLYFGAFRENEEIRVGKLMRLWIAEGFISKEGERIAENVAEKHLMELIDKSLVMVSKRGSDGRVKACIIHDLLRELCFKICKEENFLKTILLEDKFSYRYNTTWSCCQHIRSLHGSRTSERLYVRDMRSLRILDYGFNRQLIGIEYLFNLRYLVIGELPASIGNLVNLEYLRVQPLTSSTIYLPPEIVEMRKLRYIHVLNATATYDEQCNSSQPNKVEYLSDIIIGKLKDEEMLTCSPHLRKLKCKYELQPRLTKKAYPHFDLHFLTQLDSLNLTFNHPQCRTVEEFGWPSNIRKLTLSRSEIPWEKMSKIGRLENLEVLKLENEAFKGRRWDTRDGEFQKLTFLKLENLEVLAEWNVVSSRHFPMLQQFFLIDCYNLKEISCEIGEMATLQLIEVKGKCQEPLMESARRIVREQWEDMGNEELRLIISTVTESAPTVRVPDEVRRKLLYFPTSMGDHKNQKTVQTSHTAPPTINNKK